MTMREIKYRIWDKRSEEHLIVRDSGHFYLTADGEVYCVNNDLNISKEVELMQYTELTDRNGLEIFEADVLKLRSGQLTEVFYQSGCYMVNKLTTISLHDRSKANINQLLCNESIDAEVVGNIYEHPELLGDTN